MRGVITRQWVLGLALAAACSRADKSPTPPPPATMTLSLSTTALTVQAGQEGVVQVGLARTNLDEVVLLTISDLPPSTIGQFSVASLPPGTTSSTLTIAVGRAVPPGTYRTIVTATARSVNAQAVTLSLTVLPVPAVSVVAKPDTISVVQGRSGSVTLDVSRTNFTGPVSFSSEGEPAGVTVTFPGSPTTSSLATVTFAVADLTPPGSYLIRVSTSGVGVNTVTTRVQLTVVPIAVPMLAVAVTPARLTVQQAAQGSAQVTITRTDYAGAVSFAMNGLPEGVVATFSPPATTGSTATVTIIAGSNAPTGTFALTVTASGEGVPSASANIDLAITPVPAIALSATPDTLGATPGSTVSTTIGIVRTNYPGAVSLTVSGLPAGVSAAFAENPTTASSLPLQVTLASTAVRGTYLVRVTAAAAGLTSASTSFLLTIR